jgi:hypothetical protein
MGEYLVRDVQHIQSRLSQNGTLVESECCQVCGKYLIYQPKLLTMYSLLILVSNLQLMSKHFCLNYEQIGYLSIPDYIIYHCYEFKLTNIELKPQAWNYEV